MVRGCAGCGSSYGAQFRATGGHVRDRYLAVLCCRCGFRLRSAAKASRPRAPLPRLGISGHTGNFSRGGVVSSRERTHHRYGDPCFHDSSSWCSRILAVDSFPKLAFRSDLHERGSVTMTTGFSAMDYAVMLFYLVGITVWGALFRRSQRTVKDYFLGAKNISWFVISISIVATETSTLTLIGVPALAYSTFARPEQGGNLSYLQIVFVYIIARVIISLLFIPAYFQGELLTAYELLKRRFGMRTKHFAASLFLVMRALAEGVRVFAASIVLSAVLSVSLPGLPQLWLWSIIIVGLLTLIYTFEGGITAVIWTDLAQFIIHIGASLLAAYQLILLTPGGWNAIATEATAANKFQLFSFVWDLHVPFTDRKSTRL